MTLAASLQGTIRDYTCEGTFSVDTFAMCTPAWVVGDLWRLWGNTFDRRGVVENSPFDISIIFPRYATATTFSLPMLITGHVNSAGALHPNAMYGLAANMATLLPYTTPKDPTTSPTYNQFALTRPDGVAMSSYGHVLQITPGQVTVGVMRATLEVLVAEPFS